MSNANLIAEQKTITLRWTESAATFDLPENTEMSLREFRGLLAEIRDEWERDGDAGYCKVAFLAGGKSFRIDVDANAESTKLENAWVY